MYYRHMQYLGHKIVKIVTRRIIVLTTFRLYINPKKTATDGDGNKNIVLPADDMDVCEDAIVASPASIMNFFKTTTIFFTFFFLPKVYNKAYYNV